MSTFDTWLASTTLAVLVAFLFGYYLPRFSAYFLGPAFLVLAGGSFITLHKYFFPFQSDGSIAGLIVPAILWLAFATCCLLGAVLIVTGLVRAKRKSRGKVDGAGFSTPS